jgi:D-alanyl-D-alanine carboxypeptidase/D-alanyl-D-alanine-endopeptidase (penicillin-binding protein 4)
MVINRGFVLTLFFLCSVIVAQHKDSVNTSAPKININATAELRNHLDDLFNDSNFSGASWGVLIKSLKTGEILYKRNADKFFIPASDVKLFTTSAALLLLGENYRYKTRFYAEGEIYKGTLYGNLIIQGSGDPTISNRYIAGDVDTIFSAWCDSLKSKGIFRIAGNLLGDDDGFDEKGYGTGWMRDYEYAWFAAPSGALSFNNNVINIYIKPTSKDLPASVTIEPNVKNLYFINKVLTSENSDKNSIQIIKNRKNDVITIKGNIGETDIPKTEYIAVEDPTEYFVSVFESVLKKHDIVLEGYAIDADKEAHAIDYSETTKLFEHKSVQLKEIVKEINKNSNNFYSEQLIKTIGLEINNYGSIENGVKATRKVFEKMGINIDNLLLSDGSGLSRLNLVTPKQIVNLLSYMYKSSGYKNFYNSFPIAGRDGTLQNRMKNTVAENNVRGKPGLLNSVSAISGYLTTIEDEPIVFSIIANNYLVPSSFAQYIQDTALVRLINFSRK